ncbi:MAG: PorP/SprF family type IX secretion system membrane protein [Bacteroidetes bacterium]|nr:PorP/SprF family type IX secretion system membrane protein [Bacteroidota bacterium]
MKNIIIKCFFIFGMLFSVSVSHSQDIHFSQFLATPLLINPAQTALNNSVRTIANYKNQWAAFGAPYTTYAFSTEFALFHKKDHPNYMGAGLVFYNDKAGDSQMGTTEGAMTLSGIIKAGANSHLAGGMLCGFSQRSINYSKLIWENQYDGMNFNTSLNPNEPTGVTAYHYIDLGAGLAYNYGTQEKYISANDGIHINAGISAWHYGLPKYTFYGIGDEKLNTKLIAHGAVEIGIANSNMILVPHVLLMKQGKLHEEDLGCQIKFILKENSKYTGRIKAAAIGFGISYRHRDAIIPQFTYENSHYAVGISYDANISKLRAATSMQGGMEIFLRFTTDHLFRSAESPEPFYN